MSSVRLLFLPNAQADLLEKFAKAVGLPVNKCVEHALKKYLEDFNAEEVVRRQDQVQWKSR